MFASFQKKYFLSDKGVAGVKRGIFWTTLTNLITMAGMGFLLLVMAGFVEHLASGADLPDALPIVGGLLVFFVLLFASNWQQYYYTYCIFYEECGKQRMEIAERLRKLPLSFFGRRDLADLTETIMVTSRPWSTPTATCWESFGVPSSQAPLCSWRRCSFAGSWRSRRFGAFPWPLPCCI